MKYLKKYIPIFLLPVLLASQFRTFASEEGEEFDPKEFALHHIADANEWHIVGNVTIPLPVIVYHPDWGFDIFMSGKLPERHAQHDTEELHAVDTTHHDHSTAATHAPAHREMSNYHGYVMDHGRVDTFDGSQFFDLS
ncbi:MAG: hypothetical protein H7X71_08435, partial [Chitinophagales bacterium]|nr:hypothetical protein [Chitinophagales bacterium]